MSSNVAKTALAGFFFPRAKQPTPAKKMQNVLAEQSQAGENQSEGRAVGQQTQDAEQRRQQLRPAHQAGDGFDVHRVAGKEQSPKHGLSDTEAEGLKQKDQKSAVQAMQEDIQAVHHLRGRIRTVTGIGHLKAEGERRQWSVAFVAFVRQERKAPEVMPKDLKPRAGGVNIWVLHNCIGVVKYKVPFQGIPQPSLRMVPEGLLN